MQTETYTNPHNHRSTYTNSDNHKPASLRRNDSSVRFKIDDGAIVPATQTAASSFGTDRSHASSTDSTTQRGYAGSERSLRSLERAASQVTIPEDGPVSVSDEEDATTQDGDNTYRMRHGWDSQYSEEQLRELTSNFYLYYNDKRHERLMKPLGSQSVEAVKLEWRMRDRLKTVFAVLALCLNIGVDPPDIMRTNPAARLECWVDPLTETSPTGGNVALTSIGKALEGQYQQLSMRTKYKVLTDPSQEETKKFTTSVRRNARGERILFHYNGHGCPRPTPAGEVWVFNKDYTQYIPISLYDLQSWLGAPSLFVWDTSGAGVVVDKFHLAVKKHEDENKALRERDPSQPIINYRDCIHLAACRVDEILPSTPRVPADMFTCCLTTPIEIAIRYFVLMRPLPDALQEEDLKNIPGRASERRTPVGELNWIFTAITDTIAWNLLDRALFKKLFRQDLMVAALFRNFLLAQRIMRSFKCHPVSHPPIPPTHEHPLWGSWDTSVELVLLQLPDLLKNKGRPEEDQYQYKNLDFFSQQLTAFELYLQDGAPLRKEPEQLPIVLQVLLSQVHRVRALILLSEFMDFGPWAVHLALTVGIFPYVLKLLQSAASELKPSLIFIWARILAVDHTPQEDLRKEDNFKYFVQVLAPNPTIPTRLLSEHRAMCAFILAMFCRRNVGTQNQALGMDLLRLCLQFVNFEQPDAENPLLRQWACLCLSTLWEELDDAKFQSVKLRAQYQLCEVALDPVPEVRASALVALTTWLGLPETSGNVQDIEGFVALEVLPMTDDGCNLVRRELVCFLSRFVELHRDAFVRHVCASMKVDLVSASRNVAPELFERFEENEQPGPDTRDAASDAGSQGDEDEGPSSYQSADGLMMADSSTRKASKTETEPSKDNRSNFAGVDGTVERRTQQEASKVVASGSTDSMASAAGDEDEDERPVDAIGTVWKYVQYLATDPDTQVESSASSIIDYVMSKVLQDGSETRKLVDLFCSLSVVSRTRPARSQSKKRQSGTSSTQDGGQQPGRSRRSSHDASSQRSRKPSMSASLSDPGQLTSQLDNLNLHSRTATEQRVQFQPPADSQVRPNFHPSNQRQPNDSSASSTHSRSTYSLPRRPLVRSTFFDWAREYFTEPQMRAAEVEEPGSPEYDDRIARRAKNEAILERTQRMKDEAGSSRWDRPYRTLNNERQPVAVVAHQYEDHLAVADAEGGIRIWDWGRQCHLHSFENYTPIGARVTGLKFVNEDDPKALLLVGSSDGAVKLYADYWSPEENHVAAAYRAAPDSEPMVNDEERNMVFDWVQTRGQLLVAGTSKSVQVWDVASEMISHEIPLTTTSPLTSLTTDQVEGHIFATSHLDGSLRVYDQRLPPGESAIRSWHEHTRRIISVHLQRGGQRELISGSTDGIVKLWDIRMEKSLMSVNVFNKAGKAGKGKEDIMTTMSVHEHAPVFAGGSRSGVVKLYNMSGEFLSSFTPANTTASQHHAAMQQQQQSGTATPSTINDTRTPSQTLNPAARIMSHPNLQSISANHLYGFSSYTADPSQPDLALERANSAESMNSTIPFPTATPIPLTQSTSDLTSLSSASNPHGHQRAKSRTAFATLSSLTAGGHGPYGNSTFGQASPYTTRDLTHGSHNSNTIPPHAPFNFPTNNTHNTATIATTTTATTRLTSPPIQTLTFHPHRMILASSCLSSSGSGAAPTSTSASASPPSSTSTEITLFTCNEDKFRMPDVAAFSGKARRGVGDGRSLGGGVGIGSGRFGFGGAGVSNRDEWGRW